MNLFFQWVPLRRLAPIFATLISLASSPVSALAQPTIVSTVPANFASGVSVTAPVVFVFSEAMDPNLTSADFLDPTPPFSSLPTTSAWSAGNTVLTCTPTMPFPASKTIVWSVTGENTIGESLDGETGGFFITAISGGGTGSGTNRITNFIIGKAHLFNQTSAGAPVPDTNAPYSFTANTTLASNRTATAITLTLPNNAVSNLTQNFVSHENYFLFGSDTNLPSFNATWPDGIYTFTVISNASSQSVTVNLPASLVQPNAPHTTSFAAAQAVNPTQPFVLTWDAFQNGTASDYISVAVEDVFETPNPGTAGALAGTATSVQIPAGTLQPNSTYDATIQFYRVMFATNNPTYSTTAYRLTTTQFTLKTTGGSAGPLVLTNAAFVGGRFSFDVASSIGQTFTVESSTNATGGPWESLLTATNATGQIRISDPRPPAGPTQFYRARNGL